MDIVYQGVQLLGCFFLGFVVGLWLLNPLCLYMHRFRCIGCYRCQAAPRPG
jgi:hypothetical protein